MKSINLLPKKEKKFDIKAVILNIAITLLIIIFIVMVLISVLINDAGKTLSKRLSDYENVNMELQNYINKLEIYDSFKKKVNNKSEIIKYLKENEVCWSEIIYNLGEKAPDNLSISNFYGDTEDLYNYLINIYLGEEPETDKVMAFNIQGYAADQLDVSKYVIEIKEIPNIGDVWIYNINKVQIPDVNIYGVSYIIEAYWDLELFLPEELIGQLPELDTEIEGIQGLIDDDMEESIEEAESLIE